MSISKIKNKEELKKELEILFEGISGDCEKCKYIDCRGYIWLHPAEINQIIKETDTIKINGDIVFIDSFIRENNKINPEVYQPICKLRDSCGRCFIQNIKPIVCMLYPLNLRKINNQIWLVLNEDCLFVDNLKKKNKLDNFKKKVVSFWSKLDKEFLSDFIKIFNKVEAISNYPKYYHKEIIKIIKVS